MTVPKTASRLLLPLASALCACCGKGFKPDDYTAYFGGEVTNPTSSYVVLYNARGFSDTLKLDKNNRFFAKIDSLAPGLYMFKHEPEYQYAYFDKNDSLLVTINPQDFDNSIVFSGRGDAKNNFLMDLYLKNEKDRNDMFSLFDAPVANFISAVDRLHAENAGMYRKKREEIGWGDDFDAVAKASVDFPYYSNRELYPVFHRIRTGQDIRAALPPNYYDFRRQIDVADARLQDFAPYVRYLSYMLNNLAETKNPASAGNALESNITKLHIADTLFKNEKIRNAILNQLAFNYLIEDQNMANNQKFLDAYYKYSTDRSQKNEIIKIGNATKMLQPGESLPQVMLVDKSGAKISSDDVIHGKTVVFFWTNKAPAHLIEAHKKALEFQKRHPDYTFIAVNLDEDYGKWKQALANYNFGDIVELKRDDFDALKSKWAIIKIHRTIVLDGNGKISNGFTSLFDSRFEDNLK
jgi:hypothetical protein